MSERVYATLAERAALTVRGGHSAIVDAVYARASTGRSSKQVAAAASVPFIGLWLEAPEPVLIARTRAAPQRSVGRRCQRHSHAACTRRTEKSGGAGLTRRCRRHPCCLAPLTACESS